MATVTDDTKTDAKPADQTAGASASPQQDDHPAKKPFKSKGYRIHNEITYRAIDWLLNSTIGVTMAYWMDRSKTGQKIGEQVEKPFRAFTGLFTKSEETLKHGGVWGRRFVSILAGGTAIVPLMVLMENKDRKKAMIHWMDEKIYGKEEVARNPKFAESYAKIDDEPKKGFWTGMAARYSILIPMLAVTMGEKTQIKMMENVYGPIAKASKGVMESVGIRGSAAMRDPEKGLRVHPNGDPSKPAAMQSNWDFLHEMIAFDFGLTLIYAFLHEFTFKFFSGLEKKHAEKKHNHSAPAPDPSSTAQKTAMPPGIAADQPLAETPVAPGSWAEKNGRAKIPLEKTDNFVQGVDGSRAQLAGQPVLG